MIAAVLTKVGKPLKLMDLELPTFLTYGQVLVQVVMAGICGAQLREADGSKGIDPYLPHCLGHEGSGVVFKIGPGVSKVQEGELVISSGMIRKAIKDGNVKEASALLGRPFTE